jgi:small conductance mechanosensitive channel
MTRLLVLLFFILSAEASAQDIINKDVSADFATHRLQDIPSPADDRETERLLATIAKKAGWFPEIKIGVAQGIVTIEGRTKDAEKLKWLKETADRLPTVIATVNKAEVETAAYTDMTPFFKEMKRLQNLAKKNLPITVVAIVLAAFFIFLGFYVQKGMRSLWQNRISNPFLAATVTKLAMLPVWVLFFYLTLMTLGMQGLATTIIGGTGVLGIVLGFAFKGIAENFLSGLLLAIRSPFTKGDMIKVDNFQGVVQNLNMRGTTIMDLEGNLVLIPNTNVIQSVVTNFTVHPETRLEFVVGIDYKDSVKEAQEIIMNVLKDVTGVLEAPAPAVFAEALDTSSVNIRVQFWFNRSVCDGRMVKSRAISLSKEALMSRGISIPDGARELLFSEPLKVEMLQDSQHARQVVEEKKEEIKQKASSNLHSADGQDDTRSTEHELVEMSKRANLPGEKQEDNLLKMQ